MLFPTPTSCRSRCRRCGSAGWRRCSPPGGWQALVIDLGGQAVGVPAVKVRENEWIALPDGTRLAARLWLPETAERVPAVLEFLTYRKRDGTAPRDESTYPVFAAAGYAGVRVDMRGSGERSEEHTSELQSLIRISYAVFCLKKN